MAFGRRGQGPAFDRSELDGRVIEVSTHDASLVVMANRLPVRRVRDGAAEEQVGDRIHAPMVTGG